LNYRGQLLGREMAVSREKWQRCQIVGIVATYPDPREYKADALERTAGPDISQKWTGF
jgi:hypothetical protein